MGSVFRFRTGPKNSCETRRPDSFGAVSGYLNGEMAAFLAVKVVILAHGGCGTLILARGVDIVTPDGRNITDAKAPSQIH